MNEKSEVKKGLDSLRDAVLRDLKGGEICPPGARRCKNAHHHDYCATYHWTIDRAKHYAKKLGVDFEAVLESWELDRDYWYMNYY